MANIHIVIDEKELRKILFDYLSSKVDFPIESNDIIIETKSKQNYRSEWENAAFRAVLNRNF